MYRLYIKCLRYSCRSDSCSAAAQALNGPFAKSWETRRCRFIVHIADLSALVLIHELPEWTSKHYATVRRDSRKRAVSYVSSYIRYSIPVLLQGREVESNGYQDGRSTQSDESVVAGR